MLVQWDRHSHDGVLISRMGEALYTLAVDDRTGRVCAGSRSGELYEFDFVAKKLLRRWQAHRGAVFGLLYQEKTLISVGHDGRIVRWNDGDKTEERQLSDGSLRAVAEDRDRLWVCGAGGKVWCLEKEGLVLRQDIPAVSDSSFFAVQPGDKMLFLVGRDAKLTGIPLEDVFSAEMEETLQRTDAHWFSIHALALSPGGKFLATGSMDKTIKLWNAANMELLKVIDRERYEAHTSSVNGILWLDETTFVSCGDDRRILAFELDPSPIFAP